MHFHGVFMVPQNGQPAELAPRKHMIAVPPRETVAAGLIFGEAGPWAFHCHLFFHILCGMIAVAQVAPGAQ
jgi:FtsP/CotA-like multicopper oxidase with cupredoxin domain